MRIITLQEAQQKAAPADNNPLVRLGQLQVEVARQTRLGTRSSFFPQIGSTFTNLHFNKFMGQELQLANRTVGVPLTGKDQTFVAVTATQPITPLFQLRELYKINLADERIARAKAGMPVSETANKVEKAYYELLVAQRQLAFANVNSKETENKWTRKRCGACAQKTQCTTSPLKYLAIHMHESARQRARDLANTPSFANAQRQRKKVEALFAELKNQIGLRRLRLRRMKFVREQFFLAAAAQNIKRLVRFLSQVPRPPLAVTA